MTLDEWFSCPECGSDDVDWLFSNGRLSLYCENEDCLAATSRLVGRATFR